MAIRNVAMNAYSAQLAGNVQRTGRSQAAANAADAAKTQGPERSTFSQTMRESLTRVNDLQEQKEGMIEEFASGERQNVHELMISLQKAGLAMRMTSTVRNKVLEAYKELSRMSF